MVEIHVNLTDTEYKILKKIKWLEGENGEKLHSLLKWYIKEQPSLKSDYYRLQREETQESLDKSLHDIWNTYEETDTPLLEMDPKRVEELLKKLEEINVVRNIGMHTIPTGKFKDIWKTVIHDVITESPDMNEFSAACLTTLLLLNEFSMGTLTREELRDATILLNEGWLFIYAAAIHEARSYIKKREERRRRIRQD